MDELGTAADFIGRGSLLTCKPVHLWAADMADERGDHKRAAALRELYANEQAGNPDAFTIYRGHLLALRAARLSSEGASPQ